jgi:hypothetical protein
VIITTLRVEADKAVVVAGVRGMKKERMVALRPHTPKRIRGGW